MSIPHIGVHPDLLVKFSQLYNGPFQAVETLADKVCEPATSATNLNIDTRAVDNKTTLIFQYNGAGLDKFQIQKMLSLGYTSIEKEEQSEELPLERKIGFLPALLRIGRSILVFSKNITTASVGFLSLTFLKAMKTNDVMVPMLEYSLPDSKSNKLPTAKNSIEFNSCLKAILDYSLYNEEAKLLAEIQEMKRTETRIIISEFISSQDDVLELDFDFDPKDIRRAYGNTDERCSEFLRVYLKSVFEKLKMKITLRGSIITQPKLKGSTPTTPACSSAKKKRKNNDAMPESSQTLIQTRDMISAPPQPTQEATVNSSQISASDLPNTVTLNVQRRNMEVDETSSSSQGLESQGNVNKEKSDERAKDLKRQMQRIFDELHAMGESVNPQGSRNVNIEVNLKNN